MARIGLVLLVCLFASCATSVNKPGSKVLSLAERDNVFASQNNFENILNANDPIFVGISNNKCIKKWHDVYAEHKAKLKNTTKLSSKIQSWFVLGTCFAYAKSFKKTLYYYELVLSQPNISSDLSAKINFNIAQMYEVKSQVGLARLYYQKSAAHIKTQKISIFKQAVLDLHSHEFNSSIAMLNKLNRLVKKSELVDFLRGVNYYHLNKKRHLNNKVLNQMDEKSVGSILLKMAVDVHEKKNVETLETDLRNLEVNFKLHRDFKNHLLKKLGS